VYSESAGIHRIRPSAIAVPADSDDLAALLDWARREGITLIARGSGSSMSGAAIGPGVIVDLSRWKDVGPIEDRRVVVGPGAICETVNMTAGKARLRFPVSPSSAAFCTIGGMTATNAAGAHTLAFGSMREWVTGIECQFADGTRTWVRRGQTQRSGVLSALAWLAADPRTNAALLSARHEGVRKESSGYATAKFAESADPVDLLVGSEGTLAFFTNVELGLLDLPGAVARLMGVFPSLASATEAAMAARESGAVACELLDKTFLDFVATASGKPIDPKTEAILLADAEGSDIDEAKATAQRVAAAFRRAGATEYRVAVDPAERDALWSLRHAASPMLARLSTQLRSMQFIEDGAVPPERLGEYVSGIRTALDSRAMRGVIFGHAGDAHVHVNPLVDVHAPDWREKTTSLLEEVTALVGALGGTLSGEHGDGRLRTPLLGSVWKPESLAAFAAVKRTFDPDGLLNRGVKTDAADEPFEIKYDPALPPLPHGAVAALEKIESDRAYSNFRLDLIGSR
jgi:FAD/FMN-containing dehydrogenase